MPRPSDMWAVLDPLAGIGEDPDGSNNAPPITTWYYGWTAAWCAMWDSFGMAHAGFSDDNGETLNLDRLVPGLVQTTPKGWAFVPYLERAFEAVGLFDGSPREGDLGITRGQEHTFLVWRVNDDGTVNTFEGNYGNHAVYGLRRIEDLRGFCHPPWDADSAPASPPASVIPLFPGNTRRGSRGDAVLQVQRRLGAAAPEGRGWVDDTGHPLAADGDFGLHTEWTVRQFQENKLLVVDGEVGPITWAHMWVDPIT